MDTPRSRVTTAERIDSARTEAGLTRRDLSERSGIPYTTLFRKLNGHSAWTIDEVAVVAAIIGVPARDLIVFPEAA